MLSKQLANVFGNFICFNQLIVEKFNSGSSHNLFKFESTRYFSENYSLVVFTNCEFRYNKLGRLFTMYGCFDIKLESCIFKYSHFQVIKTTDSPNQNSVVIKNSSFYGITTNSLLMDIYSSFLHLEGPVVFSKVKADRILYVRRNVVYHDYIEFSENNATLNDHIECITVQENTLINMTNIDYSEITMLSIRLHYMAFSMSNFTSPCYYQYAAEGHNFDQLTEQLNFSIVFHNDISILAVMTAHCK